MVRDVTVIYVHPACGPKYSSTNLSYGQVLDSITPSCLRGAGAPNQSTLCDRIYNTCYCYDYKDCPSPLLNINATNPNLILEGFRENVNDCGFGHKQKRR